MAVARKLSIYNPGRRKLGNVGELVTITLPNGGRKKKMAYTKRRRKSTAKRRNTGVTRRRRTTAKRTNSGSRRVVYRYRTKRHNSGKRRTRRNPGMLSGNAGKVVGILGGATVTGVISSTFVPAAFRTGIMGYLSTAVVAMAQGKIAGKVLRNATLGKDMTLGGFVYLGLQIVGDFLPASITGRIPIGLRGMGILAPGRPGNPVLPTAYAPNNMLKPVGPSYQLPAANTNNNGAAMAGIAAIRRPRTGRI